MSNQSQRMGGDSVSSTTPPLLTRFPCTVMATTTLPPNLPASTGPWYRGSSRGVRRKKKQMDDGAGSSYHQRSRCLVGLGGLVEGKEWFVLRTSLRRPRRRHAGTRARRHVPGKQKVPRCILHTSTYTVDTQPGDWIRLDDQAGAGQSDSMPTERVLDRRVSLCQEGMSIPALPPLSRAVRCMQGRPPPRDGCPMCARRRPLTTNEAEWHV